VNERCIYCKHFEYIKDGAKGMIGEDICSCRICCEEEEDCQEYEEG